MADMFGLSGGEYNKFWSGAGNEAAKLKATRLKAYQTLRKKQEEEEEQRQLEEQAKANAEEANRGLGDKAVGVAKGLWSGVKEGIVDPTVRTAKNVANVAESIDADNQLKTVTKAREGFNKEANRRMNEILGDKASAEELDDEGKKAWEEYRTWYNDAKKKFEEVANPIEGRARREGQDLQDIDAGQAAADAANTFLNVATLGTGTAVKTAATTGGKAFVKGAVRGAAEGAVFGSTGSALTEAAKEDGDILGGLATGAVGGAVLGGLAGGVGGKLKNNKLVKEDKIGSEFAENMADAAASRAAKKAAKEATETANAERLKVIESEKKAAYLNERKDEYYGLMFARDAENAKPTQKLLPSKSSAPETKALQDELKSLKSADIDPEVRANRMQEIQKELDNRKIQDSQRNIVEQTEAEINNGQTLKDVNKEIADFTDGTMPDDVKVPAKPVQNAADIRIREEMPQQLRQASNEILRDMDLVQNELAQLTTPENYRASMARIDESYRNSVAAIEEMPPARQELEMARLNDEYAKTLDELTAARDADAARVADLSDTQNFLFQRERDLVDSTNALMAESPNSFRAVDPDLVQAKAERLAIAQKQQRIVQNTSDVNRPMQLSVENGIAPSQSTNPVVQKAITEAAELDAPIYAGGGKDPGLMQYVVGIPKEELAKFGDAGKKISTLLDDAVDNVSIADSKMNRAVLEWNRAAGGKEAMSNIARALDGDLDAFANLNDAQKQVFQQIRAMFNDYGDRLGLQPNQRIQDYLPHIFNGKSMSEIDDAMAKLAAGVDENGVKLTEAAIKELNQKLRGVDYEALAMLKKQTQWEVKNGFLKHRTGAPDYSFDLEDIITTYTHAAHNTEFLNPAFAQIKGLSESLTSRQNQYLARVIHEVQNKPNDALGEVLNTTIDNIFGTTGKYDDVSQRLRHLIYDATLGFNVGSAARNLTQTSNTYALLGEKFTPIGMARAAKTFFGRNNESYLELLENGVLMNRYSDLLRGEKAGIKGTFQRTMWGLFQGVEQFNRGTAYFGAKERYLSKAMAKNGWKTLAEVPEDVVAKASKAGREMSRKTQFEFGALDVPVAQTNTTAKNILQFQSFTMSQTRFLKRMGFDDKNFAGMARYVGSNLIFIAAVGASMGMKPTDIIPYFGEFKDGNIPRSPLVKLLAGDNSDAGLWQLGNTAKDIAFAGSDSEKRNKAIGDLGADTQDFIKTAAGLLIPGGTQAKKTIEAAQTNAQGFSKNDSGNIRFTADKDAGNQARSLIFGQYATDAGRSWITDGFPTLSKDQTQKVNEQNPADREKYVAYYQAIKNRPNRQNVYDEAKSAMAAGQPARAKRLVDEYNSSVAKSLRDYYKQFDSLPKDLEDTLNSRIYIKFKRLEDE